VGADTGGPAETFGSRELPVDRLVVEVGDPEGAGAVGVHEKHVGHP
jgi:hypothetical protein